MRDGEDFAAVFFFFRREVDAAAGFRRAFPDFMKSALAANSWVTFAIAPAARPTFRAMVFISGSFAARFLIRLLVPVTIAADMAGQCARGPHNQDPEKISV